MNPGNSEPRQVAGESSLQGGRGGRKRRRQDQNDGVDDGPKYPLARLAIPSFECPFSKRNPHRYPECRGHRLIRLADVTQHIKRKHHIPPVEIQDDETVRGEDTILYCARCRHLFRGMGAAYRLRLHSTSATECQITDVEQSGVTIPRELEALKSDLEQCRRESDYEKWYIIWERLFPGKGRPRSPHIEISVPRLEMELILQNGLGSILGLEKQEAQAVAKLFADMIHSSPLEPRTRPFIPLQAEPNSVQTAPMPSYDTHVPSIPAFTSQPAQPQTQSFTLASGQPSAGVHETPTGGQEENSFDWNNTLTNYSAPSPIPGSGVQANSGNNSVDSGYFIPPDSGYSFDLYARCPPASFESATRDDDYSDTYENPIRRHG